MESNHGQKTVANLPMCISNTNYRSSTMNNLLNKLYLKVDVAMRYAKENPADILLGFIALALFDIEQDVDELEELLGE